MRNLSLIWFGLLCFFSACKTSKIVLKDNKFYSFQPTALGQGNLDVYTVNKPTLLLKVTDKESFLSIAKKDADANVALGLFSKSTIPVNAVNINAYAPFRVTNDQTAYFIQAPDDPNLRSKFTYMDAKPVFQAVSIPLKIRPRPNLEQLYTDPIKIQAAKDSFPTQTESGFNFGFALGYKFNYNIYKNEKDLLGRYTNQFSFAVAGLVGTGTADISRTTARPLPISGFTARKTPLFSFGGLFMIGFNNINAGYAIGVDHALGSYGKRWVYQGQLWHGIIISLDVIK